MGENQEKVGNMKEIPYLPLLNSSMKTGKKEHQTERNKVSKTPIKQASHASSMPLVEANEAPLLGMTSESSEVIEIETKRNTEVNTVINENYRAIRIQEHEIIVPQPPPVIRPIIRPVTPPTMYKDAETLRKGMQPTIEEASNESGFENIPQMEQMRNE